MPDRNHPLAGADVELHRLVVVGDSFDLAVQFACYRIFAVAGIQLAVRARDRTAADRCGGDPVVLAVGDLDIPARWELRSSGLWAEQVCEQPDVHWSYGLEAFALQIDKPDELLRQGYGFRTPLGWELDFEIESIDNRGQPDDETFDGRRPGAVEQVGAIDGLMLVGPDEFPIAGSAHRIHVWGDRGFVADAVPDRSDIERSDVDRSDVDRSDSDGGGAHDGRCGQDVLLPTPIGVWAIGFRA